MDYLILNIDQPESHCGIKGVCGVEICAAKCKTFEPCGAQCSTLCGGDCTCFKVIGGTPVGLNSIG